MKRLVRWTLWLALGAGGFFAAALVMPAAGAPAVTPLTVAAPSSWSTPAPFDFGNHTYERTLENVSCPTASFCVAVDSQGYVMASSNPTGDASAWTSTNIDGTREIYGISCPSSTFCAAVDAHGNVMTSTAG